jgi:hydroxyacylglutathione hydrolase
MEILIKRIKLAMPLGMGSVNCYLLESGSNFVLVDTGGSYNRKALVKELESAGCQPGLLKLIVLTHGDFDHTGNAACLRTRYSTQIAMHASDAAMGEKRDMFANRRKPNRIIRALIPLFTGFGKSERFSPDLLLEDGDDLNVHGFDARVLSIPGHSQGSIGILTTSADFFCGDLLENTKKPVLNSLIDDLDTAQSSLQRLQKLGINTVYPGHGDPFLLNAITNAGI